MVRFLKILTSKDPSIISVTTHIQGSAPHWKELETAAGLLLLNSLNNRKFSNRDHHISRLQTSKGGKKGKKTQLIGEIGANIRYHIKFEYHKLTIYQKE